MSRWGRAASFKMCMRAKSFQLSLTLCDPMDRSPPGYPVHGVSQARILEGVAISSSRGSSKPRDGTRISYVSLHWQAGSLPQVPLGKPLNKHSWVETEAQAEARALSHPLSQCLVGVWEMAAHPFCWVLSHSDQHKRGRCLGRLCGQLRKPTNHISILSQYVSESSVTFI